MSSFFLEMLWEQSVKTLPIIDPVQVLDFYEAMKGLGTFNPSEPPMFGADEVRDLFEQKYADDLIRVPGCWSLRDVLFEGWVQRPKRRVKLFDNTKRMNIIKPKGVSYARSFQTNKSGA
jgi:hypothetical protein